MQLHYELSESRGMIAGFTFDGGRQWTEDGSQTAGTFTGIQKRQDDTTRVFHAGSDDPDGTSATFYVRADGQIFHESIADRLHGYRDVAAFGQNPTAAAAPSNSNNWSVIASRSSSGETVVERTTHQITVRKRFGTRRLVLVGRAKRETSEGIAGISTLTGEIFLSTAVAGEDTVEITSALFNQFTLSLDITSIPVGNLAIAKIGIRSTVDLSQYDSGTFSCETFLSENLSLDQSS